MGLPHFILLYVDEPQASAEFYARLLERKRLDSSPNFVMFELSPDLRLGLWARRDVEPAPISAADTGELAMAVATNEEVEGLSAIGSAKSPRFCKSRPPWTSAGPSVADPDGTSASGSCPRPEDSPGESEIEACFCCRSSRAGCNCVELGAVGAVADRAGRAPKGVRKSARLMTGYRARLVLSLSRLIRQGWPPPYLVFPPSRRREGMGRERGTRKDCFVILPPLSFPSGLNGHPGVMPPRQDED